MQTNITHRTKVKNIIHGTEVKTIYPDGFKITVFKLNNGNLIATVADTNKKRTMETQEAEKMPNVLWFATMTMAEMMEL